MDDVILTKNGVELTHEDLQNTSWDLLRDRPHIGPVIGTVIANFAQATQGTYGVPPPITIESLDLFAVWLVKNDIKIELSPCMKEENPGNLDYDENVVRRLLEEPND